jgi:hypothetical protein
MMLDWEKPRREGATGEEIAEALGAAIAVNAGAGLVYSARVMDASLNGMANSPDIRRLRRRCDEKALAESSE